MAFGPWKTIAELRAENAELKQEIRDHKRRVLYQTALIKEAHFRDGNGNLGRAGFVTPRAVDRAENATRKLVRWQ